MNIEKLNELQKCLEILRMDELYDNREIFEVTLNSTIYDILRPLLDSIQQEDDTDSKLFKFLTKLDKNLKAIITVKMHNIEDDKTLYEHRRTIQQWIKYYENGLKDILAEYE